MNERGGAESARQWAPVGGRSASVVSDEKPCACAVHSTVVGGAGVDSSRKELNFLTDRRSVALKRLAEEQKNHTQTNAAVINQMQSFCVCVYVCYFYLVNKLRTHESFNSRQEQSMK